jgi:NAD(P)-dependent dehydrogenase (short-subunit alcohol dehydrogenase family)
VLVNNAGIIRDRMIFAMSEEEFDAVVRVHLKGHFCMLRHATAYWRDASKVAGGPVYARVINTSPRLPCSVRRASRTTRRRRPASSG